MKLHLTTREEQIHNYAYNNCMTEDIDDNSYSLIVDAIKWADETMLEKACEWYEEKLLCAEDYYPTIEFLSIIEYNSLKELINDFRKSIEE